MFARRDIATILFYVLIFSAVVLWAVFAPDDAIRSSTRDASRPADVKFQPVKGEPLIQSLTQRMVTH